MITREEYALLIELALQELSGIILRDAEDAVATSLPLRSDVDEAMRSLREEHTKRSDVLVTSFGLIDEFVKSRWDLAVEELFQEYVTFTARGTSE